MILDAKPDTWDRELAARLRSDEPDVNAVMDLYDCVAPAVWSYARHRTRNRTRARQAVIAAFLTAADAPHVFDGKVSLAARMLMIVHVQTERRPDMGMVARLRAY